MLVVLGALVAAALVLVLSSLGGSSSSNTASTSASTVAGGSATTHAKTHKHTTSRSSKSTSAPANAAEINVAVLNGTEATGLAHRVSGSLQQHGYSQATALSGHPPGSNQVTVVQYANGHQTEAQGVARSLSVTQVQPMEAAVASLAGSAKVAVIVGADMAATAP
jgi:LytR cell envelope-related transcriptional attenuator